MTVATFALTALVSFAAGRAHLRWQDHRARVRREIDWQEESEEYF